MEVQDGQVNVVEELGVVLDRVAGRKEDDDLLLFVVLLQEGEEEHESLVALADHVALLQAFGGGKILHLFHINIQGRLAKGHPGQILNLGGLGGRKEEGLTLCSNRKKREEIFSVGVRKSDNGGNGPDPLARS